MMSSWKEIEKEYKWIELHKFRFKAKLEYHIDDMARIYSHEMKFNNYLENNMYLTFSIDSKFQWPT